MNDIYPPPELELDIYKSIYTDLCKMNDEQLTAHYNKYGRVEGRISNRLADRGDFASLITHDMRALEIGPFTNPLIAGENVAYADYLNREDLIKRAQSLKRNFEKTPSIDYVLSQMSLADIEDDFDAVISSHCIEHQPDLIQHLLDVQRLIKKNNGRYFLLVPDKRYCFDRFNMESTIAEIIDAHMSGRKIHSLKSIIEHALTTHNNPIVHWNTPAASKPKIDPDRINKAIKSWEISKGQYIDVHAWYFTPFSFSENIALLHSMGIIELEVERIYFTRQWKNEFWAILNIAS